MFKTASDPLRVHDGFQGSMIGNLQRALELRRLHVKIRIDLFSPLGIGKRSNIQTTMNTDKSCRHFPSFVEGIDSRLLGFVANNGQVGLKR